MKIFSPILKGTTTVSQGTTNLSGSFTGSLLGTAATASYADNFTVGGTLTAQTINVQIITSSIEFNTGSTRNGALSTNTHQFTGSVLMSGSLGIGTSSPSSRLDIAWGGYQTQGGAVNIGADIGNLTTRTNNTTKYGIISAVPYTTSDKSIELLTYYSNNTEKVLSVGGGGNTDFAGLTSISFLTTSSLTQPGAVRMTVNSAGNVGIGTSSPGEQLTLSRSSYPTVKLIETTDNASGYFQYHSEANEFRLLTISSHPLIFSTTDTERMRITSGGNVGIGTTTPGVLLHAKTTGDGYNMLTIESTSGDAGIALKGGTGGTSVGGFTIQGQNGGSMVFVDRNSTPATRMTISSNGSIGAPSGTNIYNASDVRLKKNISTTTYGLNAISALNPVKFNWIDGFEPSEDGKDMLGFIAQEMQNIIPEAVESFGSNVDLNGTTIENTLRVNEKFIIPVLVKAIQELKSENDTLKEILQRNNIQ
jgi:hypothetical protein